MGWALINVPVRNSSEDDRYPNWNHHPNDILHNLMVVLHMVLNPSSFSLTTMAIYVYIWYSTSEFQAPATITHVLHKGLIRILSILGRSASDIIHPRKNQ